MSFFPLKKLPRYECLLQVAEEHPDLDPSATEAYLHLLRAGDEAFQVSGEDFARHRLSAGGFMVLMLLLSRERCGDEKVPNTPAELAEHAGVTRATMTGLIDTLEQDGLVRREPDPDDRRRMSVKVTPHGRNLLRKLLPGHFRRIAAYMRPLSVTERKTLVRLLRKILPAESVPSPAAAKAAAGGGSR